MWALSGSVRCISAVATATWKTSHVLDGHTTRWGATWSAHLHELADYDQGTVYRAQYWPKCLGNNGGNVGILQSLHQVDPTNAHTAVALKKSTVCKFIRAYWTKQGWRWRFPASCHLLVMRSGVTAASWSQKGSLWGGDMWIPHQRKRHSPQQVK